MKRLLKKNEKASGETAVSAARVGKINTKAALTGIFCSCSGCVNSPDNKTVSFPAFLRLMSHT